MTEQSPPPEDPTADAAPSGSEADQPAPVTEAAAVPPPPPPEPPTAVTPPPPPSPTTPPSAGPRPGEPVAPPPPPPFPPPPAGPAVKFGPDGAGSATAGERPEIPVAAAFAGGFVLAMILKRLAK